MNKNKIKLIYIIFLLAEFYSILFGEYFKKSNYT